MASSRYRYLAQSSSSIDQILGLTNKLQIKQNSLGRELDLISIPSAERESRRFSPSLQLVGHRGVWRQSSPGFYLYRATLRNNTLQCCFRNLGAPLGYIKLFVDEHVLKLWNWTPKHNPQKQIKYWGLSKKNQFMIKISLRVVLTFWQGGKIVFSIFTRSRASRDSSYGHVPCWVLAAVWGQSPRRITQN